MRLREFAEMYYDGHGLRRNIQVELHEKISDTVFFLSKIDIENGYNDSGDYETYQNYDVIAMSDDILKSPNLVVYIRNPLIFKPRYLRMEPKEFDEIFAQFSKCAFYLEGYKCIACPVKCIATHDTCINAFKKWLLEEIPVVEEGDK